MRLEKERAAAERRRMMKLREEDTQKRRQMEVDAENKRLETRRQSNLFGMPSLEKPPVPPAPPAPQQRTLRLRGTRPDPGTTQLPQADIDAENERVRLLRQIDGSGMPALEKPPPSPRRQANLRLRGSRTIPQPPKPQPRMKLVPDVVQGIFERYLQTKVFSVVVP